MEFIESFRRQLGISKYSFSAILDKRPPAYESLIKAYDRITLRDIVALRKVAVERLNMSDAEFLDVLEAETQILEKGRKLRKQKRFLHQKAKNEFE